MKIPPSIARVADTPNEWGPHNPKPGINNLGRDGLNHLLRACSEGEPELVAILLSLGADSRKQSADGTPPIHKAAFSGNTRCVELLLRAGAGLLDKDSKGRLPIHLALQNGQASVSELLADSMAAQGIDPDHPDQYGKTPISIAAIRRMNGVMVTLLSAGADPNHADMSGISPLMRCVSNNNTDGAILLLNHGANPLMKDSLGRSAFDLASEGLGGGVLELMEMLSEKFALESAVTKAPSRPAKGI